MGHKHIRHILGSHTGFQDVFLISAVLYNFDFCSCFLTEGIDFFQKLIQCFRISLDGIFDIDFDGSAFKRSAFIR